MGIAVGAEFAEFDGGLAVAGDDLVFPLGGLTTNTDDFPNGTNFKSITVASGYVIAFVRTLVVGVVRITR